MYEGEDEKHFVVDCYYSGKKIQMKFWLTLVRNEQYSKLNKQLGNKKKNKEQDTAHRGPTSGDYLIHHYWHFVAEGAKMLEKCPWIFYFR